MNFQIVNAKTSIILNLKKTPAQKFGIYIH